MPFFPTPVTHVSTQPALGLEVKAYRTRRSLTTTQAAAELGTTVTYYEGWEAGNDMKLSTAVKLTEWMTTG